MIHPDPYIIALNKQIEIKLGFKIDKIKLASEFSKLLEKEKLYVSAHTIGRLFGFIKPFRTPYKETLNVLVQFLHYKNWDDFCNNQTNIPFDVNYFLTEQTDGFSLAVLQAALVNEDLISLETNLNMIKGSEDNYLMFSAGELIGNHIRKLSEKDNLLRFFSENRIGHLLFYECFVDEDNENGYFYNALISFYLPNKKDYNKLLFAYSYLVSQDLYKYDKKSKYISFLENTIIKIDEKKCHFHEISRLYESYIIIDYFNGILIQTWDVHLNNLIEISKNYNLYEQAWMIVRTLKALLYFGYKQELFNHKKLNKIIDNLIKKQRVGLHSVALYSIQLYWLCKSIFFSNTISYYPFRIQFVLFQNESNEKTGVELGIAYLYATGENKIILEKNIFNFCKNNGLNWIVNLLKK